MGEVIDLPVITSLDLDPARVLAAAAEHKFSRVIIIGVTEDGEDYRAFSDADMGHAVFDMERAKRDLLSEHDDG